ncbi:hypothetical protein [Stenotrophomonas acidaminiphila]|uniref:hypothetical protein n=1 Tax=Stenotrophomonas acidaminiphila TaxID=128780 RepID=UPI0028A68B4A|nr:hypothetical protein [Stenotrophomonas acidaminiphila]
MEHKPGNAGLFFALQFTQGFTWNPAPTKLLSALPDVERLPVQADEVLVEGSRSGMRRQSEQIPLGNVRVRGCKALNLEINQKLCGDGSAGFHVKLGYLFVLKGYL